jgi:hypothetical protein
MYTVALPTALHPLVRIVDSPTLRFGSQRWQLVLDLWVLAVQDGLRPIQLVVTLAAATAAATAAAAAAAAVPTATTAAATAAAAAATTTAAAAAAGTVTSVIVMVFHLGLHWEVLADQTAAQAAVIMGVVHVIIEEQAVDINAAQEMQGCYKRKIPVWEIPTSGHCPTGRPT